MSSFLRWLEIRHISVAPFHPASNGAAERAVRTVKEGIKASGGDGRPIEGRLLNFLLMHRSTPTSSTGRTPPEMLLGRNIRSKLDLLVPGEEAQVAAKQEQMMAGRKLRQFQENDLVWARRYSGPKMEERKNSSTNRSTIVRNRYWRKCAMVPTRRSDNPG